VLEALEALRLGVGAGVMVQYVLQGLFHAARKVRDIYWRIWNLLVVGAQHAMVPSYPQLRNTPTAKFHRYEMDMFL